LVLGAAATLLSCASLTIAHSRVEDFYFASLVLGVGIGLSFAALANAIVDAVPQSQTGVATGINTVMRMIGIAIGGQTAATIVASSVGVGRFPSETAFTVAFGVSAFFASLALVSTFAVPRVPRTVVTGSLETP
jgi:MFS family permease